MVDLATTLIGILGATLIPAYIALYLVTNLKSIHIRYIAAAAVGLAMWYFLDTILDSAELDVNSGFTGGLSQAGLLIVFILGIVTLSIFDYFAVPRNKEVASNASPRFPLLFLIPAAVAAVMGIHGLGEGWDFATAASSAPNSLVDAFGGLGAVASYPLHKFLEASVIAAVYSAYFGKNGVNKKWHLPVLGLLFGLPSLIGSTFGYYNNIDTTYFFAFGTTAAFYAIIRLVEAMNPSFKTGAPSYLGWKVFLSLVTGFLLLYTAALLHA